MDRQQFRTAVLNRDNHQCVICKRKAVEVHHILERKLFDDEGYHLNNGAALCVIDHLKAERTIISCDEIREKAGIEDVVLPPHFHKEEKYDKWGNILLDNKTRLRGELFYQEGVQKVLREGNVLNIFTSHVKYPRTYHLPWSPGVGRDDRVLSDTTHFEGKEVILTAKMDGEGTTMYNDHIHARSLDSKDHESRSWVKSLHGRIAHDIPEGWRICGENLYAEHSIHYNNLRSHFMLFSVWNEKNECLPWQETVEWAELLGLHTVPVLYEGLWDEEKIMGLYQPFLDGDECEGFVVRVADSFSYRQFRESVAKYVREKHIQTNQFWMRKKVVRNELRGHSTVEGKCQ